MAAEYPVVWMDVRHSSPTAGKLTLADRHALLVGRAEGASRRAEFDASEVEHVALADRSRRLRDRPTLTVGLRGRGLMLIAELNGVGVAREILEQLTDWV